MFDFVYLSSIRRADDVERPRFLMGLDLTRVKIHGIIIWIRRCYITTIEHPASAASPVQIFFIRSLICVRSLYRKAAITSQYETRNANVIPPPLSLIKNYFFKKKMKPFIDDILHRYIFESWCPEPFNADASIHIFILLASVKYCYWAQLMRRDHIWRYRCEHRLESTAYTMELYNKRELYYIQRALFAQRCIWSFPYQLYIAAFTLLYLYRI